MKNNTAYKDIFKKKLQESLESIVSYVSTKNGQWSIKGFIDIYKNIYTISSDTKTVSKILEIHLFPKILEFAEQYNYKIVLADHQNYYPDISFIDKTDDKIKFAVDFKTTYRNPDNNELCNGFTLGSHGEYFINRTGRKNIQFPYEEYLSHFCFEIIYDRVENEKIIKDIKNENGMFSRLGEEWFDDYWKNYNKIVKHGSKGEKIRNLYDFITYRRGNVELIVPKRAGRHNA
jgi:hypothetical protein